MHLQSIGIKFEARGAPALLSTTDISSRSLHKISQETQQILQKYQQLPTEEAKNQYVQSYMYADKQTVGDSALVESASKDSAGRGGETNVVDTEGGASNGGEVGGATRKGDELEGDASSDAEVGGGAQKCDDMGRGASNDAEVGGGAWKGDDWGQVHQMTEKWGEGHGRAMKWGEVERRRVK